ncbi:hypothetical protein C4F50_12230 [Flavobacterium sp. KB82]|uniref:Uncharacterized protein n=1 Tax=Flavobacterium hungaricum TaxID=2082725 RepID=A0ABR9TK27_9FLAO|nr:hypothetical protein [Flavobacterium hungaricum]
MCFEPIKETVKGFFSFNKIYFEVLDVIKELYFGADFYGSFFDYKICVNLCFCESKSVLSAF